VCILSVWWVNSIVDLEDAIDDKIDIMLQWIVAGNCIGIAATKMMH